MAATGLAQIHISVTDLDASIAFYSDVLGLPLLFRVPGQPMAFFAAGDVRLYLGVPEGVEFTSKTVHYYAVDDIDAECERIKGLGVEIGAPHVVHSDGTNDLWVAFTQDPDGHHVALMCERPTA